MATVKRRNTIYPSTANESTGRLGCALLRDEREPILITQHGVPSAYLVDVETFETLQRRMTLLEGIARGEKAIEDSAQSRKSSKAGDIARLSNRRVASSTAKIRIES